MPRTLTAIVLTFNEEQHIARCLKSLAGVATSLLVVDCGSTDRTRAIAGEFGARVLVNPWTNYASQFNWALDHGNITTEWCLRIDADEHLSAALRASLTDFLAAPQAADVTGLTVKRTVYFLGRPLRWGAMGGLRMLRVFRADAGRCENRWMDEHITLRTGRSARVAGELFDENLNNIGWWVNKHNGYATREAIDLLQGRRARATHGLDSAAAGLETQARVKRFIKHRVYAGIPPTVRASLYFFYRYFARLGFLDGRAGLAFCVMQALWYRMLVDIKVLEIQARMRAAGKSLEQAVFEEYGVRLDTPADGGSKR